MFGRKKKKQERPRVCALIAAAGGSSRMGGIDKLFEEINGLPVIAYSLLAFENSGFVDEIVVVTREENIAAIWDIARAFDISGITRIVAGGSTRQQSVFAGVAACGECDYYLVHDGARPLVTEEIIARCLEAAQIHGAAAAGVRSKDTLKIADESGFVAATPDRERCIIIQTPQCFDAGVYKRAMDAAMEQGSDYTDDCQLVERCGGKVFISEGSYSNIKITTPDDLIIAGTLMALNN